MSKVFRSIVLAVVFCCLPLAGCKGVSATTPATALAPGALNQFDQSAYQALAAAHAFAVSAKANAAVLTASQKAALNAFISALNAADALYIVYHSGAATEAQMSASLATVTTSESSYTSSITGAK